MRRTPLTLAALAAAALAFSGCAGAPGSSAPESSRDGVAGELTVYAAASLASAFDDLAAEFERLHPDLTVRPIVYDGSSTLAVQLLEGAPADVFASADEANMQAVTDAGLAADPHVFATNTLVIAVPDGNPRGVADLGDLADPEAAVVLCAAAVPCGAASATLLANAGVAVTPASEEQNVTAVLTKVAAGEADAGLVYATDIARASGVEAVAAAGAADVVNRYPIAALTDAANPVAADAFVAFVLGGTGRAVLADRGFGAP
ncbi:molybdate ABC transporter substrate-binding protein [Microbacter sp. GSS18]|nr:molybdate ABC transporter substrate-binding protein [Microbacter sp. GSS18]